jgi:homoserine kinase
VPTVSPVVRVPASTSNLGAGFDCVGLALDLWLEAQLVEGAGPPRYGGTLAGLDPQRDLIAHQLEAAGLAGRWHLAVHSDIPVGKGLGSSGAAVVAGLALVELARGTPLNRERLLQRGTEIEGHPDNVGPALFGGLFLASQHPSQLTIASGIGVALAVPERSLDTHAARARLPREVPREVAIAQASRAAALVLGLTRGDPALIAYGMDDQLAVPYRKDLIAGFEHAVAAGRAAGAYGVTISGAGSALLALCPAAAAVAAANAMAEALTAAGNAAAALTPTVARTGLAEV